MLTDKPAWLRDHLPMIIGYRKNGSPIWSVRGGADDGDSDAGGDGDGDGDSGAGDPDSKDGSEGDDAGGDDPEELKRLLRKATERMSAADRRASEAEKKLKDAEDAELGELDKAKKLVETLQSELEAAQAAVKTLKLQVAMLQDDSYDWHDRSDVLSVLEHDETVTIDDDGNVEGVKAALKKLATSKPYLVKTPANGAGAGDRASGDSGAGRSGGKGEQKKELLEKFPALRGRSRPSS